MSHLFAPSGLTWMQEAENHIRTRWRLLSLLVLSANLRDYQFQPSWVQVTVSIAIGRLRIHYDRMNGPYTQTVCEHCVLSTVYTLTRRARVTVLVSYELRVRITAKQKFVRSLLGRLRVHIRSKLLGF
jgi:hypothetical protein